MKVSIVCPAIAGAAFLILEGCTQSAGAVNPPSSAMQYPSSRHYVPDDSTAVTSRLMRVRSPHSTTTSGLYVTQAGYGVGSGVVVYKSNYKKNKSPICSIPLSNPEGITADALGNMYVVSDPDYTNPPATIYVYGPHCGPLIATVTDPYGYGATIAVHGSTWYVDNYYSTPGGKPGNVAVCSQSAGCYADLTAPPTAPFTSELYGAGVDKKGNVYADADIGTGSKILFSIFEWPHGKNPGKLIYSLPAADRDYAGGQVIFDSGGNMFVGGQDRYYLLTGCPSACVTNGPISVEAGGGTFALNKKGTELFVANSHGSVDVYKYNGPSAPTYLYSVTNGLTQLGSGKAVPYAVTPVPANTR